MSDLVERLDGLRKRASKVPGGYIYHQDRALWIGAIDDAWPGIARALRAAEALLGSDLETEQWAMSRLELFNALDALKEAK